MKKTSLSILSALAFNFLICTSANADFRAADTAAQSKDWARVAQACRADANAGERHCQFWMAKIYKEGLGVGRNLPLSIDLLKKCSAQGHPACEEMLGDSYRRGVGVDVNYAEALRLFRSAASRGNSWALNNLGEHHRFGQGVPASASEAATFYRLSADKGNPVAQGNLANLYRLGDGVEKNADAAFQLALKSSQQNYGIGWAILGMLYRDGAGVRQDTSAAISAFKKAIDPGVTYPAHIAYALLANIHFNGIGTAVDMDEAARWAEAGVRINQRQSLVLLANILGQNSKSTTADKNRAFELAKRAHDLGVIGAKNTLGTFYRDEVGTPVDLAIARRLLTEGAEAGDLNAAVNLGVMYREGLGVPKDTNKAHEYFVLAQTRANTLGPRPRQVIDAYFSSLAAGGPSANQVDSTQAALLERIERMQRQIEMLQGSASGMPPNLAPERPTHTAVRRALVIGNDRYKHVQSLVNARQDAKAIAATLKRLGYAVLVHEDVDEKKFKQVLRDFRALMEGGEEVLFFFAGHGVQLGSANYLLPTDIKGETEEQVRDGAIDLQRVLDDLKSKSSKFALAIIDACRDNPFKTVGRAIGGRGLAPTTAASGQMIMFSAGAGQQALDKLGTADKEKNSVFTRVLLKEMVKPGIPVDRVLRNVRNEVVRLSKNIGHEQTPALYDQAVGDFYFSLR